MRPYSSSELFLIDPANVFLVEVEGKRVLVDAGPSLQPPEGFPGDRALDAVLLTHWHWDHVRGLAWAARSTSYVCASESTLESVNPEKALDSMLATVRSVFGEVEALASDLAAVVQTMTSLYADAARALRGASVRTLDECPVIRDGLVEYLDCPGHSHDHVCYIIKDHVFVGDNIIPGSSVTLLDVHKYLVSMVKLLGETWNVAAVGHKGPLMGRLEVTKYIASMVEGKLRRLAFISALAGRGWIALSDVFRQVYNLRLDVTGFIAARSLVGYVSTLEELGVIEVDRNSIPWRIRAKPNSSVRGAV